MRANMRPRNRRGLGHDERGQSMVEFAMILPLLLVVVLGVVEVSYALMDQHVVTKLTREGSNLISRDTSLKDAAAALKAMSSRPVDFDTNSKLIFSVIRKGATTGTSNFGQDILYQRLEFGALSAASVLQTKGAATYGPPDYQAANADADTGLQLKSLPAGLVVGTGSMVYVTEVYTKHELITPFDKFGVTVPDILYSIAFF
jgi:Flp pilus assembly pilin Flp